MFLLFSIFAQIADTHANAAFVFHLCSWAHSQLEQEAIKIYVRTLNTWQKYVWQLWKESISLKITFTFHWIYHEWKNYKTKYLKCIHLLKRYSWAIIIFLLGYVKYFQYRRVEKIPSVKYSFQFSTVGMHVLLLLELKHFNFTKNLKIFQNSMLKFLVIFFVLLFR